MTFIKVGHQNALALRNRSVYPHEFSVLAHGVNLKEGKLILESREC
jgi:hypothetical protein